MPRNLLKNLNFLELERAAARFRVLGEASRLSLLRALHEGEKSVNQLVEITKLSQPNVSRHLALLTAAGIIARRKSGSRVLYRIVNRSLMEICAIVCRDASSLK